MLILLSAPSEPPKYFKSVNVSSTEIRLVWKPVDKRQINGVLRGYVVYWCEGLSPNATVRNTNVTVPSHPKRRKRAVVDSSSDLSFIDLRKYTWYRFQIMAYTIKKGVLSPEILVRTAEDGNLLKYFPTFR